MIRTDDAFRVNFGGFAGYIYEISAEGITVSWDFFSLPSELYEEENCAISYFVGYWPGYMVGSTHARSYAREERMRHFIENPHLYRKSKNEEWQKIVKTGNRKWLVTWDSVREIK